MSFNIIVLGTPIVILGLDYLQGDNYLNNNLKYNSVQSAIKKFQHESIGIIEGCSIKIISSTIISPGVISIEMVLAKGFINLPYLFKKDDYSFLNEDTTGCFLIEIKDDINVTHEFNTAPHNFGHFEVKVYLEKSSTTNIMQVKLGFNKFNELDVQGDFNATNAIEQNFWEHFLTIFNNNDNSYYQGGSYGDNNYYPFNLGYIRYNNTDGSPSVLFMQSYSAYIESNYYESLSKGQEIDLIKDLPHWTDEINFSRLLMDNLLVFSGGDLLVGTLGFKFNFYPKYKNDMGKYIIKLESENINIKDFKISVLNRKGSFNEAENFIELKNNGKVVYRSIFILDEYTGSFFILFKNKKNEDILFKNIKFLLDADIVESSNGNIYKLNKDKSNNIDISIGHQRYLQPNNKKNIPDIYIDYKFTYDSIFRSLDSYLAINEIDDGYLKYNNKWFSGVVPYLISNGNGDVFIITPINLLGLKEPLFKMNDEENLLNYSFLKKGFPLLIFNTALNAVYQKQINYELYDFDNEIIVGIDDSLNYTDKKMFAPIKINSKKNREYNKLFYYGMRGDSSIITLDLLNAEKYRNQSTWRVYYSNDMGTLISNKMLISNRKANLNKEIQLLSVIEFSETSYE